MACNFLCLKNYYIMHKEEMQFGFAMFVPGKQFILDIPLKVLFLFRKYQTVLKVTVFYTSEIEE